MNSGTIRLNPYPYNHRFAFTLIHDADSAYSQRLRPVTDELTALHMPITVTVFTLWADWARNGEIWRRWNALDAAGRYTAPVAIPLEDRDERCFYQGLADQNHEIAMHTPSETSDKRERISYGFEYFQRVLGSYPRMYVEHSRGNKLDAQTNLGSIPGSEYYNTDLLNDSGCWIWLDYEDSICRNKENGYDILAACDTLFDHTAQQRFGIHRAFFRSGRCGEADGSGFLRCYSCENIDSLVLNRGVAMVYTHLNFGWLDLETQMMREPIRERLAYLRRKNGWFTTASNILDRFRTLEAIDLVQSAGRLTLTNRGEQKVDSVSLVVDNQPLLFCVRDRVLTPDKDSLVPIGDLLAKETLTIAFDNHRPG